MKKEDLVRKIEEKRSIRDKRRANRESAPEILKLNGVDFKEERPDGSKLTVAYRATFWPGSGRWYDTKSKVAGFGIFRLISHLKSVRRMEESSPPSDEHSRSS